jgi:hypothetical protein
VPVGMPVLPCRRALRGERGVALGLGTALKAKRVGGPEVRVATRGPVGPRRSLRCMVLGGQVRLRGQAMGA